MMKSLDGTRQICEASEIGLPPGIWPLKIEVEGVDWMQHHVEARNGEILYVTYRRADGKFLDVVND
jgi:hypothetical protein